MQTLAASGLVCSDLIDSSRGPPPMLPHGADSTMLRHTPPRTSLPAPSSQLP